LNDGEIVLLGRGDHQVKVRGFRIELKEIQILLERHPEVIQATATAQKSNDGTCLVVFLETRNQPTVSELRKYLREYLPDYMMPARYVFLNPVPRAAGGKDLDNAAATDRNSHS